VLALAAAIVLALGAGPQAAESPAPRAATPPDVLLILIDDLNDWVGCLGGNPQAQTPHIDRLAARGMLFTNAHTPAPSCNPARVALFTGLAPHTSGVYDNDTAFRIGMPDALTLPQRLGASGYAAFGAGKVFHHVFADPSSWDDFFPAKELQIPPDSVRGKQAPIVRKHGGGPVAAEPEQLGDGKVAAWIAAALAAPARRPFFAAAGFYRPHTPWIAPEVNYARFPLEKIELPPNVRPERGAREGVRAYLACTSFADDMVGRVLDALDASPRARETIVILCSDNGFHLGEKGLWAKSTLWEESTRVPLIVVAPGVAPGTRCARPVSLIDLLPTVLELCGAPPVAGLDGQSLVPLLRDPERTSGRPALTTLGPGEHTLRSERWRYVRHADGSDELYDHASDPDEERDVSDAPENAAVKAELARWLPASDAPPAPRR
jgi:arylsulfatase A-like enzyme